MTYEIQFDPTTWVKIPHMLVPIEIIFDYSSISTLKHQALKHTGQIIYQR